MKKNEQDMFPMRLQKYLSACGFGSRRACEQLITEGKVLVNGNTVSEQGVRVEASDEVFCNGQPAELQKKIYIVLNKPVGYLSSNADPYHELFARDLITIKEQSSLFHVGRLDLNSSGLIIYTNDGNFAQRLSHPSFEVEKEYIVETRSPIDHSRMDSIVREGITIEGVRYHMERYRLITPQEISIVLKEGKNREIRKIFQQQGHQILSLHRVRIGDIVLGNLPSGSFRAMSVREIRSITGEHTQT